MNGWQIGTVYVNIVVQSTLTMFRPSQKSLNAATIYLSHLLKTVIGLKKHAEVEARLFKHLIPY